MQYQLIHHDGAKDFTLVEQSPDLASDAQRDEWYARTVFSKALPTGRFWGLIDENHASYTKPKVAAKVPVVADVTLTDEQSFEQIMLRQKELWRKEQIAQAEEQEAIAKYLRAYKR